MNKYVQRLLLISLIAASPFGAFAQERISCDEGNIQSANPACQRQLAISKHSRSTVSLAEHQALFSMLTDFRNTSNAPGSITTIVGDDWIDQAMMTWLDWYKVALSAREENKQLLETESWRSLLGLAHRDPFAALNQLNKSSNVVDDHAYALRLLLAGMLSNKLQVLANAAGLSSNNQNEQESQRLETYVNSHTQDFNIGETCYGANYNGKHYSAVEKRYPSSDYAQAAAYLAMEIVPCGECEGDFSCYLSNRLMPTEKFLSKYPKSNYLPMLLKRVQNELTLAFGEKQAQADYLSANNDYYAPLYAANVLINFEKYLKSVAPADLIRIKITLADLYIKLNQYGNAKRTVEWLSMHAPDEPEISRLKQSISSMKKFAITLNKPKPYGPNIVALEWTQGSGFNETPMQLWRSESPDFNQAIAIGEVLPKGSVKVVDTTAQSDTAYWYRIETVGENKIALSHTAFAQTWSSEAHLLEIIFDQTSKSLFGIGRVPENSAARVLLSFPKNLLPKAGHIKNLKPLFASPLKENSWWVDKDSNTVLMADQAGVMASHLNLNEGNKADSNESKADISVTIDLSKKHALSVNGGLSARSPDGKSVYVWDKKGKLLRTDFSGKVLEIIFEESKIGLQARDKLKPFYLFARHNGEVFLAGQKQSQTSGTLFTLRKLSRSGYSDIDVSGRPSYNISSPNAWLFDTQQEGLWFADVDGQPGMFGLDGKLMKTLSIKLESGRSFLPGHSLAFDRESGDLFVANSTQIIKVNRLGKANLVWEKIDTHPGGQLSQAKLITDREKALEQQSFLIKCELDKEWLGLASSGCQNRK